MRKVLYAALTLLSLTRASASHGERSPSGSLGSASTDSSEAHSSDTETDIFHDTPVHYHVPYTSHQFFEVQEHRDRAHSPTTRELFANAGLNPAHMESERLPDARIPSDVRDARLQGRWWQSLRYPRLKVACLVAVLEFQTLSLANQHRFTSQSMEDANMIRFCLWIASHAYADVHPLVGHPRVVREMRHASDRARMAEAAHIYGNSDPTPRAFSAREVQSARDARADSAQLAPTLWRIWRSTGEGPDRSGHPMALYRQADADLERIRAMSRQQGRRAS